ncbi:helicase-exonuclease AddAB subunit AddB [Tyzzerella sp. OttesenSCG-928-J15]|nr:helicase-exonuclease AddAB subunit AddB [Tyzzerella sp. OttesenSCG-928-J15]
MALRFIFGGPGSGKTTHCINEIVDLASSSKGSFYYIVPEQYSLEAEKSLVNAFAGKAAIKAQVLSFERLAYRILSETGVKQGGLLDYTGKNMVIRKIVNNIRPELKYYRKANIGTGLVKNIADTIKELYQYEIKPEDLHLKEFENISQKNKFEDLMLIYSEYRKLIESEFISADTTLDILNSNIEKSSFLDGANIWIDNFTGFTPQEYRVIRSMIKHAAQVNICVGIKEWQLHYAEISADDIFYEAKKLINTVSDMAREENINIAQPCVLKEMYRFKNSPELMWIEANYTKVRPAKYQGENNRVFTYSYKNKFAEIYGVADKIVELVRDKGLNYSQIAIVSGSIESYGAVVQSVFGRYGIPYFVDMRMGILAHPLTELVRSLFEVINRNWSYESVFHLLKTDLLEIDKNTIDMLENYALAYGIQGYRWSQPEWRYGFAKNSGFDKDEIHRAKEYAYETVSKFTAKYSPKKKIAPAEVCEDIYYFLMETGIQEKLSRLAMEAAENNDMQLYREHSGIWNTVMGVLDKISSIFGDSPMSLFEFAQILESGLASCDMGIIPPAQDRVIVGDIYRTRLNEIKALFVIGVTNDSFPKQTANEGLFDDRDKGTLSKNGIEISSDSKIQSFVYNHMAYYVFTKASDYLYISYPENDMAGKSMTASPVVYKLERLMGKQAGGNELNEEYKKITLPQVMLKELGEILNKKESGAELDEFETALLSWYTSNLFYEKYLDKRRTDIYGESSLSPEIIDSLYKPNIQTSISRLEKYVACPFSYFLRYNIKAEDREYYQVKNVDLGNIFHDVLELFSQYVEENSLSWDKLEYGEIQNVAEELFGKLLDRDETDIFDNDSRTGYILQRVKKTAVRSIWALSEHIKKGEFKPYGAEVDFGISSPLTGIVIDINGQYSFTLTGRIDRVDILDKNGNNYVKVIDYKSGSKKFDITDIYYGMQMQLMAYMGALMKNGDKILGMDKKPLPGGILYFRLNDPVIDYTYNMSESDLYENILDEFKMSGLVLDDKTVIEGIDGSIEKSSGVVPVSLNAKGEYVSRSGSLATKEVFEKAVKYTENKIRSVGEEIISGNIEAKPYKKGISTGCDYCAYNAICGFNPKLAGSSYKIFAKKKSIAELEM